MEKRYGKDWLNYKQIVPKWIFLWRPTGIPEASIYFDSNCSQCSQIGKWFGKFKTVNLKVKSADNYPGDEILQVTYVDFYGTEYKSVKAIACALEHMNLASASLGWMIRMPIISYVLQAIVDSMNFGRGIESCEKKIK